MKFEAASTAPAFANSSQNGTEPSAKSIQTGFLAGSEQALPVAALGAAGRAEAPRPATASSTSREIFFTPPRHQPAGKAETRTFPRFRLTFYDSARGVSTSGISSA